MLYRAKYFNTEWSRETLHTALQRNRDPFDSFSLQRQIELDFGLLDYQALAVLEGMVGKSFDTLWDWIVVSRQE